jgi:hypothetical protein
LKKRPRRWKQNSDEDNFHPSSYANHQSKESYFHHWIHVVVVDDSDAADVARATVADTDGDGGDDKVHKAAARNAEVASYDVALPSPLDTASEPTVVVPQPVAVSVAVVCSSPVGFVASMNQNRLIVASLLINGCSLFLSLYN